MDPPPWLRRGWGGDTDALVLRVFPWVERLDLDPDALTWTGTALCAAAGTAFALDAPVWAGLGLMAAGWCDLVDGVVARRRGRASLAGGFLDSTLDRLGDMLVFGGIALGAAARGQLGTVGLALWAATAAFLVSYARARAEVHLDRLADGPMGRFERFAVLIAGGLTTWVAPALGVIALGASWTAAQRVRVARARLAALERGGGDPPVESVPSSAEERPEDAT